MNLGLTPLLYHNTQITCVQRAVSVRVLLSPVHGQIVLVDDVANRPRREIADLIGC